MATDHNFRIKNGLEVGGELIVDSSGHLVVADITSNQKFHDGVRLRFGNSSDLQIYHSGNDSFITHSNTNGYLRIGAGTQELFLHGDRVDIRSDTGNEAMLQAYRNGGVNLYYDNTKTFETVSGGAQVNGSLTITGDINIYGDINTQNVTNLDVQDKVITVGKGQSASNSTGSGLLVSGSNASMLWDNSDDRWEFNKDVYSDGAFEVGNIRIYKSGDSNHLHIDAPTAIIGPSTTTSSNPSLGTSSYRFDGLFSSTGNFAGNVTITGNVEASSYLSASAGAYINTNTGSNPLYITRQGNTNESLKIHVGDSAAMFESIQDENEDNYGAFIFAMDSGPTEPYFDVRKGTASSGSKFTVDGSGKVGISSHTPQYPLDLRNPSDSNQVFRVYFPDAATTQIGTSRMAGGATQGLFVEGQTGVRFGVSGTEYGRFHSNGNFGIGTTSPSKKFEVHDNGKSFTVGEKSGYAVSYGPIIETNSDAIVMPTTVWLNNSNVRLYKTGTSARLHGDGGIEFGVYNGSAAIEAMRIKNDGKVGIGTASPTMPLSVQAASNAYAISMHGRSDGYSELYGASNDGSIKYSFLQSHSAQTKLYTLVNTPLLFGTNSAERMRISNTGKVGINTTSPGYRLDIGGSTGSTANTLRLHQANTGTAIRIGAGSGSSDVVLFRVDGDSTNSNHGGATDLGAYGYSLKYFGSGSGQENRLKLLSDNLSASSQNVVFDVGQNGYINFEQRVGIGTDSAQDRLNIHDSASDANLGIKITRGGQTHGLRLGVNDAHAFLWTSEAQNLAFATSGTQRMTVLSGGQIGINTATANTTGGTARLTIVDSTVQMSMGPSNQDNMYIRRMGGGLFQMQTYNSGNSGHLELEPYGGKVGIGTSGTVSATLHVQNTTTNAEVMRLTTTGDDPDRNMYFQSDHIYSNGNFYLGTGSHRNLYRGSYHTFHYGGSNTEAMRVNSNGRVGIGTTNPSTILHIHGAAGNPAKLAISEGGAESRIYTSRNSDTNSDLRFQTEIGGTIADRLKIDYSGNTVVTGNLIVQGTTTTLNTATLDVEDKNITLNYGSGDTSGTADGAGITVQDAVNSSTDAYFKWFQSGNKWLSSNAIRAFGGFELPDNNKLVAGDSNDLEIFHNGTDSIINEKGTGTLRIQTNGSNQWEFNGTIFKGNDGREIVLGDSSDLKIFHDGSHSEIREQGQGDLRIRGDSVWVLASNGQNQISAAGGVAKLYNSGSEKLATESTGVNITGRLKATDVTVYEGNSLAGGMFKEKQVTGSGSSNDLTFFAEGISNGGDIHFMTGGSATVRATISSTGLNVPGRIDLSNSGYLSFYGNGSEDHSIGGYLDDDIRINSYGGVFISLDSNGNNDSAADFLIGKHAGASAAFGTNDQLFKIRGDGRAGDVITVGNIGLGATLSYPKIAYPGSEAQWSATGTSTGQVIIDLPGTLNNYDMMYMEIDIYEYTGEAGSKIIFGGHNWNSGGNGNTSTTMWHNTDVKIVGEFSKSIYVGWRNNGSVNKRVIVLGEPTSTWSYGSVHVSKVHGANLFYQTGIDWTGDWNVIQSTSSSAYNKSPSTNFNASDRRVLRVHRAIQGQRVYGDTDIRTPILYDLDNTTYRFDGASTSKLKNLEIGNTDSTVGEFKIYDTGNNALELKSTGTNAFQIDLTGTSSTGQLLHNQFEHTFTSGTSGTGSLTIGKQISHTGTADARIAVASGGSLYLDSKPGQHIHLGWWSSSAYDVISEMGARFARYRDRNDTQYLLDPANTGTSLNIAGGISSGDGTSSQWKQAYDNYITGVGVSGTTTKTITLTQRDGGTISTTWTDYDSNSNNYVDSLSFSAGTVRGGTSGTGVLTVGRSGSLSDLTVDLDGRYLQHQYMNNWTRVGYGDGGANKWHKLCTVTITGAYQDYNVGFFWTDRYDRGEASIHVHSDNDTTADVWGARFVGTADSNKKAASDIMYTKSGSTVEVFVKTPSWREFDYIRNDAVTEGTPSITWYDESTTTEYTSQPSNVTAFSDQTPISQNGYNKSFSGDLQDRDNSQYYLDPADTSVINQLNVATNIRHNGDTDTYIQFTDGEIDFFANGQNGFMTSSGGFVVNPNSANYDFIVRGDNESNLIYGDASTDRVGIGTATPSYDLDIVGASAGLRVLKSANDARVISQSTTAGGWFEAISPNYYSGMLHIIGGTEQWALGTLQGQSNYTLRRGRSGAIVLTALTDGKVGINNNTPQRRFVVTDAAGNAGDNSGILSLTVGSGANTDSKLAFGIDSGHRGWIHVVKPGTNVMPLLLNPTGSSNGKVGIGFSGQNPSAMLDVEGGALGSTSGNSVTAAIIRAGRQNLVFKDTRTANGTDWNNATFKMIAQIDSTNHQSIDFVNDSGYNEHIDILTGNQVFNTRFTANGKVGIGTNDPNGKLEVKGGLTHLRGGHSSSHNEQIRIGRSDDLYRYHSIYATNNSTGSILEFRLHDGGSSVAQTSALSVRQNIGATGDIGTHIHSGTRLGFDESGTRSWTMKATGGGLNLYSGDGAGHFQSSISGGFRAPIFYDSDDTARYLNLNGTNTSELGRIRTNASASITAPRWDTSFYVAQSQHYYGHSASQTMYLGEANHIHIRNIADIHGSARAPVYYDRDNTNYYLDAANSTTAAFVNGTIKINSSHNHGNFVIHYDHGSDADSGQLCAWVSEPGLTYNNGGIGANIHESGPYYGRFINSGYGVYARFNKSDGQFAIYTTTATRGNTGGQGTRRFYVDASGNSHSVVSSRAPVFYDSADTNYFVHPGDGTISAKFRETVIIGDGTQLNSNDGNWGARLNLTDSVHSKIEIGQDDNSMKSHWYAHTGQDSIKFGTSTSHDVEIQRGGATKIEATSGGATITGIGQATSDFRAPIFYDRDNTDFYIDPVGSSKLYGTLYLGHTNSQPGSLVIYDTGNNALEIKGTGANAFQFDMTGTGSTGTITFNDFNLVTNKNVRINAGSSDYTGQTNVDETILRMQTDFDGAGVQNLQFVNHNGNWLDGTTGADTAFGWMWSHGNNQRAGVIYDHRSTEKFDIYSSYGEIRFRTPASVNGNISPIGSESTMPARLRIAVGGAVIATNDMRAPIFYDSADTTYYLDPYDRSFYRLGNPSTASSDAFNGDVTNRRGLTFYHSVGPDMTIWGYGSAMGNNAIRIWAAGATGTTNGDKFEFKHDGSLHADGDITAFSTVTASDIRLKENVRDLEGSLDKTLQLRGVKFDWKEESKGNDQLGFIAQEVEEVLPEVVNEVDSLNPTDENFKVVNYSAVVPVLVEAIKELKAEIDELKEQLKKK